MTNFADQTIWTVDNLDILRGLNSESVGGVAAGAAYEEHWRLSDLEWAYIGVVADD